MKERKFHTACKYRYDEKREGRRYKGSLGPEALKTGKHAPHTVLDRCHLRKGRKCLWPTKTFRECKKSGALG